MRAFNIDQFHISFASVLKWILAQKHPCQNEFYLHLLILMQIKLIFIDWFAQGFTSKLRQKELSLIVNEWHIEWSP